MLGKRLRGSPFQKHSFLAPGSNIVGTWKVIYKDGDKATYIVKRKGLAVHMRVYTCKAKHKSTCRSPKDVIVVKSKSKKYPSKLGWLQVSNIHGGTVTVYVRKAGSKLGLIWKRPKGHPTVGTGLRVHTRKWFCLEY